MANYGSWACPCKWIHPFGGPGQRGKCRTFGPPYSVGVGGNCGPEGDSTNNINTRNITFRRITGTVQSPGSISCRKGNPCGVNLEDIQLTTSGKWSCANVDVNSIGSVVPAIPACPIGPNITAIPPPPPGPLHDCRLIKLEGCYADKSTKGNSGSGVLPKYQPQLHDIVTQENCASACFNKKDRFAGIDVRATCLCLLCLPLRLPWAGASLMICPSHLSHLCSVWRISSESVRCHVRYRRATTAGAGVASRQARKASPSQSAKPRAVKAMQRRSAGELSA